MSETPFSTRFQPTVKPKGWRQWLSRWPILLHHLRLGRLTGHQFIVLTHRGRRTGQVRQTAIMVLRYDPAKREAFVVAWSHQADWYRNIQATPACEVSLGSNRYRPSQRFLTTDEVFELLTWCRQHRPFQARIQCLFFGWPWTTSGEVRRGLAETLAGVAFRPAVEEACSGR